MTCEFICVGTELLLGNILNTNAKYLSEKCAEYGISVFYQTVVGDNPERLEEMVRLALSRSDCIIFSGGLGPTTDDLTKETVAKAFGLKLVEDAKAKEELLARMNRYGRKITENNFKQALIPEGQKERVLKKLYPFGTPPAMAQTLMDIHEHKEFVVKDFKVVQQGDYVLLASPYFASSGGSVVDWEPVKNEDGVHVAKMPDELAISAFSAGEADALTGRPFGTAKPARGEGMSKDRYRMIEEAYAEGFASGEESRKQENAFFSGFRPYPSPPRRSFRGSRQ